MTEAKKLSSTMTCITRRTESEQTISNMDSTRLFTLEIKVIHFEIDSFVSFSPLLTFLMRIDTISSTIPEVSFEFELREIIKESFAIVCYCFWILLR